MHGASSAWTPVEGTLLADTDGRHEPRIPPPRISRYLPTCHWFYTRLSNASFALTVCRSVCPLFLKSPSVLTGRAVALAARVREGQTVGGMIGRGEGHRGGVGSLRIFRFRGCRFMAELGPSRCKHNTVLLGRWSGLQWTYNSHGGTDALNTRPYHWLYIARVATRRRRASTRPFCYSPINNFRFFASANFRVEEL